MLSFRRLNKKPKCQKKNYKCRDIERLVLFFPPLSLENREVKNPNGLFCFCHCGLVSTYGFLADIPFQEYLRFRPALHQPAFSR